MKKHIVIKIMVLLMCTGCQTTRQATSRAGSLVGAIGLTSALIESINPQLTYLIDERSKRDFSGFEVIYADQHAVYHNITRISDHPATFDLLAHQRSHK